jgi:NAD(P)-dependent dehydrogenase (short-subunit alcohol dehydrogenase family)
MQEIIMATERKVWFITGVSRGLGKVLAEYVAANNDIAIGTTRDGKAAFESANVQVLPLEITDAAAVRATIARAHALHGRLDVVVNNAGYGLLGPVEEATEADVENLFAVNFHGTRRVVQAVLPYLRKQRAGHILNITSIAGLAPGAGSGFYAASKFAVEGFTQSLALEVAPLGIKVTLVEPGAFRTDFLSERSIRDRRSEIPDYAPTAGATQQALAKMAGKQVGDPRKAAAALLDIVREARPPLHLVLGSDALRRTRDMQAQLSADLQRWESVSLGTDFPTGT